MTANSTLSNEIAADLRAEILRGQYRDGDRLPSERDLSARYTASRGAVREALSERIAIERPEFQQSKEVDVDLKFD